MVINELRRDSVAITQNEYFAFEFDPFYDRRNGIFFTASPIGGRIDGQSSNEQTISTDFNPIWDSAPGRFDGGWVIEAAIPFKSMRYRPGRDQVWGFQAVRSNRWRNEVSFLVPMPPARGSGGIAMMSRAATVVGLEVPPPAINLDVKPYAIADLTTDRTAVPRVLNDPSGAVGLDVKYGVTQNLSADLTVNTDFAQVEADEQQINLTRFSLFFPEKREFFLENQGMFAFGGIAAGGRAAGSSDAPMLFYSRRIGLAQGRAVPIQGGGRLTGRVGAFSLGLLNIQTANDAEANARATNFSVVRLRRDILRRSNVGALFTSRSSREGGRGSNQTYGVDGTFTFLTDLNVNTYWARSRTPGLSGNDTSYRAQLDYPADRYGVQIEHLFIGDDFSPEVGFVRRRGMRKSFGEFRFSPRPQRNAVVRKYSWTGSFNYIENGAGRLETREVDAEFAVEMQSGDRLSAGYNGTYEFLPRPFRIAWGVVLPVGGYDYALARAGYDFGGQRVVSGNVSLEHGSFYGGDRTTLRLSRGRIELSAHLSVEPSLSLNWVDLAEGSFSSRVVGSRVTYTMTPEMFASALVQYNSGTNILGANVRFRWEYQPGSELFVVYNDQRDTELRGFPELQNRAVIVKINRLFRF
jgi:hypothetical protein